MMNMHIYKVSSVFAPFKNPDFNQRRFFQIQLQLGFDSFIVVDDNPIECAEIQANCPDVLTLQLPQQADRILVAEQAVVMPISYAEGRWLVKPWVHLPAMLSIQLPLKNVIVKGGHH